MGEDGRLQDAREEAASSRERGHLARIFRKIYRQGAQRGGEDRVFVRSYNLPHLFVFFVPLVVSFLRYAKKLAEPLWWLRQEDFDR